MNFFKFFRCTNVKRKIQLCNIFLQSSQIIFYLCGMAKKKTTMISFRISEETDKVLREYISSNTLNFTAWIHRLVSDRLKKYGVIDEQGEVQGDWLNPETQLQKKYGIDDERKGIRRGFLMEVDLPLRIALNNFTAGNCGDGTNRSDCLRMWITHELLLAGAFGNKGRAVRGKLQKRAA